MYKFGTAVRRCAVYVYLLLKRPRKCGRSPLAATAVSRPHGNFGDGIHVKANM